MKILTERQYAEAINEAIERYSERRNAQDYVEARLRDVEEQLRDLRSAINEQWRRIDRIEEIYPLEPEKAKRPRGPEAAPAPLITTPVATWEDKL